MKTSYKKFDSTIDKFDGNLWGYHLIVPIEIKEAFVNGKDRRVLIKINGYKEIPCAIMMNGEDYFFININKEIRKPLKLDIGSKVQVEIRKDESKYGMPMPEELGELLYMDPEADKIFQALTPGKQRSLMYLIAKPKSSEIRIKKAIVITEYLKSVNGKLDFKELNIAFKNYNQLS